MIRSIFIAIFLLPFCFNGWAAMSCPEQPPSKDVKISGDVHAAANLLTKWIGEAEFKGKLSLQEDAILDKHPDADKYLIRLSILSSLCSAISEDSSLTGVKKAEAYLEIIQQYESAQEKTETKFNDPYSFVKFFLPNGYYIDKLSYLGLKQNTPQPGIVTNVERASVAIYNGHSKSGNNIAATVMYGSDRRMDIKSWRRLASLSELINSMPMKKRMVGTMFGNIAGGKYDNITEQDYDQLAQDIEISVENKKVNDNIRRVDFVMALKYSGELDFDGGVAKLVGFIQEKKGILLTLYIMLDPKYHENIPKDARDIINKTYWSPGIVRATMRPMNM